MASDSNINNNFIRLILRKTIVPHFFALAISIFSTSIRDTFVHEICWSEKPICHCEFEYKIYYIFSAVLIQIICPYSLVSTIMFCLKPEVFTLKSTKLLIILHITIPVFSSYLIGFYRFPPRALCYFLGILFATFYSLFYLRRLLNLNFKEFLLKMKYPFYFVYSGIIYYIFMAYMTPVFYKFLGNFLEKNKQSFFQLFMLPFAALYEGFFSYIFVKMSNVLSEQKNDSYMVLTAKYYYILVYSLRIGNILYLNLSDWGLYLQFVGFVVFVFEHTTCISLFSLLVIKPLSHIYIKKKLLFSEYIKFNNRVLKNWINNVYCKKKKNVIKPTNKVKISFPQKQNNLKVIAISNMKVGTIFSPQNKAFMILCYQKIEFSLIYVPTLIFLYWKQTWRSPEPFYKFTVGCTFRLTNVDFQSYSLIFLIVVDGFASILFILYIFLKGKIKQFYEIEKFHYITRIFIYMSYQLTFEYWISHFLSLKVIGE